MSKEQKASVLAKCGGLAPEIQTTDAGYLKEKIGDFSLSWKDLGDFRLIDLRNDSDTIVICFWEQLPENDPVWPLAAKILGIEQSLPTPMRDQYGYYPIVGSGRLADIFNACKAQLDGPYPSTDGCIATIRRIQTWAMEAIEQPNPQKDALIEEMCIAKGNANNRIDLDAYARGMIDMYDRLNMPRPSNELLWDAMRITTGILGVGVAKRDIEEFEKWLKTIPADPLKADRDNVIESIECQKQYNQKWEIAFDSETMLSVKRLAGLEVGNE